MMYVKINIIKNTDHTILSAVAVMVIVLLLLAPLGSFAQDRLRIAVASNFMEPFGEIASRFEVYNGVAAEPVFSSTGKLHAQIVEGAPFDVFLSSDEKRPRELFDKSLADKPFVYARGQVVLWSVKKDFCLKDDWKAVLVRGDVKRVAIANTGTAPYGTVAMIALKGAGLWDTLQGKLVFPQDVAQSFQYASTGCVDAGFCALSSVLSAQGKAGCYLHVKEAPQVVQSACVLKRTTLKAAADRFAAFLMSEQANAIKKKYGYQ